MTIARSHYRYKPPPRKRAQAAPLEVPAVVTISDKTRKRVAKAATDNLAAPVEASTVDELKSAPPSPANADRTSAIVTARRPKARGGNRHLLAELPDTEEEHQRRGDRADALFQEMKREIAEKLRR